MTPEANFGPYGEDVPMTPEVPGEAEVEGEPSPSDRLFSPINIDPLDQTDDAVGVPVPDSDSDDALAAMCFVARRQKPVVSNIMANKKNKDINVNKLPVPQRALFQQSRLKEWGSWIRHDAVEFLTAEEQKAAPADRILPMRLVETDR